MVVESNFFKILRAVYDLPANQLIKGQLISIAIYGLLNSPKKRTKCTQGKYPECKTKQGFENYFEDVTVSDCVLIFILQL